VVCVLFSAEQDNVMPLRKTISRPRRIRGVAAMCALALILLAQAASAAPCDLKNNAPAFIRHDLTESFCELCSYGYITIIISNPYEGVDMTAMTVVEDLRNSGLTFASDAPTPVRYSVNGGPLQSGGAPIISGTNGSVLTWTASRIPALNRLEWRPGNNNIGTLAITFAVRRASGLSQEGLVSADRRIQASLTYSTEEPCFVGTRTVSTGLDTLPLREPSPVVSKRGRNADAGQSATQYSTTVYGNVNDDVVWRIQVRNNGLADLQDLRFSDLMQSGNLVVNYACPTEAAATAIANANGIGPGNQGCVPAGNSINNFDVDNPFGNPGNDWPDLVDVWQGQSAYIYLVGKVPHTPNGSCSINRTNTVYDIQWGCESDPPAGGIATTSTGYTPSSASATLSTRSVNSGTNLSIQTEIIGTNTSQPAGSKGTVRITIRNNTGGTVKGIKLRNLLPSAYVVDPTFTPAVAVTPAYGTAYAGMTNRIEWTNPVAGTFPLTTSDPALPLANTAPEFRLYSSTTHPHYADQFDMLRHGDRLIVTFRIVLIRPQSYDKVANLDVRTEAPNSDPPGTDPDNAIQLTNRLYVDFEDFCDPGVIKHPPTNPLVTTHQSNPEDLDINIAGNELVFILTGDPDQRLPLTVNLRNNGGHEAADYVAYITFGASMNVVGVPAGCALTTNPPPLSVWRTPASIPPGAAVYRYAGAPIAPGQTVALTFEVVKSTDPAAIAADDLTFRADVVGEITLTSGAPLWFPTPVNPRADGGIDRANNYSLDGIRARVIGFNLLKSQVGTCSENNPPPVLPDLQVQIGEECTFHIDTGGWFGFQTPGFTYIAVQDIAVFDQLPDGQGYISSTDPYTASTSAIQGVNLNPAGLAPLDEVAAPEWMNWTFNQVVPAQRITEKDHWFRVDMTSRLLNDPLDVSAAPNRHAAPSINTLTSDFQAVFYNDVTHQEEIYSLGPNTVGYPRVEVRRIALTVTEPHLTVTKEVCNEDLYGTGTDCANFVPLAADGDAYNAYIYRITVTNEAGSDGVPRAPAYDVTVTDRLDASDLAYVLPFAGDGLDNDGDGLIGGADTDGEGAVSDNIVRNGIPAVLTFSYSHSSALRRIDAGQSVRLYYRVDFDNDAAPLQTFTNTAEATYDSLEGISGHQSAPQGLNSEKGGARVYTAQPDSARVRIIPVETHPKRIARLSNTPPALGSAIQEVSIGEELEYRLNTLLPVALLRNFVIRDELPAGMSCSEAPAVNLSAAPYSAANFVPGGIITPTCSGTLVEWDFGDQRVTTGTSGLGNRYDFEIGFIARIENTIETNDGDLISNGHPATRTTAQYVDEGGNLVSHDFGQVDVRVREPRIHLTKSFAVINADAGDILTVAVTAANGGTADAYNLRVLDDLVGRNLTFVGNVGGTHPPANIDTTTLGANRPIFSWNPPNGIAPGATISFTFEVRVDTAVQPHEVVANTLQATWTSLPGQNTALNSTGLIGLDGSQSGLRNGALPNAGHTVNDYEAQAGDSVTVPALTLTKTDLDPSAIPAIGVHKSFQIDIRLPEGTTHGVIVTDSLDAAGVSYVLANNAEFDITYIFQGIASINGLTPGEGGFNAFPADNTSGTAVWNIGTVVSQTENDPSQNAIEPLLRIHYYARVNNDLETDSGDTLHNSVVLTYINGQTQAPQTLTAATAAVTVVEPVLTVTKTVRNVTPGKQPGDPAAGGDRLEYAVTIPNSGTATAYDVNVVDTLSSGQMFHIDFSPTATIDGAAVAGFVPVPLNGPNGPLVWGRDNGDGSLDIPVGQSLLLTYQVVVQEVGGALGNSVWIDWTSLDNASSYERTGQGCPDWTAPNDYCAGPAVTSTTTVDDSSINKAVLADTYDVPPLSTATDLVARVGDIVTYRLALNLRGGLTRNVRVEDLLPTGLAFFDVVSINGDTSAPYAAVAPFVHQAITTADVPAAGQTGTLVWTIGDVVKNGYGDPTTDPFEIVYRVRIAPDTGIAHVASTTLTNTAALAYTGAPALSGSATVTLHQPVIQQITKTDRDGRISPASVIVADDTMRFRLQACNSGQAPAYSVTVKDQLATQLDQTSIADIVVSVGGEVLSAGSDYIYTPPAMRGGSMEFVLNTPINPGQCLIIDYDIGFFTDFGSNQVWHNSATVDAYWSLPAHSGQQYGPVGPVVFFMHNVVNSAHPPAKEIVAPVSAEATIGEEIVYRISVPAEAKNAAMQDVVIIDVLNQNLEFLSAVEISDFGLTVDYSSPPQVRLSLSRMIEAGQQATIELRARLRNIAGAQEGVTFTNTALYTFVDPSEPGVIQGGGSHTTAPIRIVEPALSMTKSVVNAGSPGNPPLAGQILRYTLTFNAAGGAVGDNFSDAFDLRIDDNLSLGLVYNGNASVTGAGNSIGDPVVTGDGIGTPQALLWSLADGNADIDIPEGTQVSVSYDVRVLDSVLANQALSNSASAQWTGLDGPSLHERDGTGTPLWNDYFTGPVTTTLITQDNNAITKTRVLDTFGAGDADVRIGDIVVYELRLGLQEGTHADVVLTDTLPQGLVFQGIAAINGDSSSPYTAEAPFAHAAITGANVTVVGDPASGPTTITWDLGNIVNQADGNPANDFFVIVYRARVLNDAHPHVNSLALTNTVRMDYTTATGPAPFKTDSETITVLQPHLTVGKSGLADGGDTVLVANERVTYTVDITNIGSAPAYDTVLRDIIPVGMRNGAATITMVGIQLLSGPVLPNLAPAYNAATGEATWDFDTGSADQYTIPAGDTLRIVYQVQTESAVGAGLTLTNVAQVLRYYSFDDDALPTHGGVIGVRQLYGPGNTAGTTFTTADPVALDKRNPASAAVAVGEPFTYTITVPATPQDVALHDVRILDDLGASAADLSFVRVMKVSGSQPWTPVNTGSATHLVIEDTAIGIDIPAGEQIVIAVTVVLNDTPANVSGLQFNNTADYTFNAINNDPATQAEGAADTTDNLTIVGPDALTLEKSGPATMQVGTSATFTLEVHNTGTGTAWNATISDRMPHEATGGMCDAAPTNVSAQIFLADGVTPASPPLVAGTDFTVTFNGVPDCLWVLRLLSPSGGLPADHRLIVQYDAALDLSTQNGTTLTNVAGVTEWFSADPDMADAAPRTYTRQLTYGTPTILDHEDSHTINAQAPILLFHKTVRNMTTGQNPGIDATPGDTLRYTLQVSNSGPVALSSVSIVDEVDRLNPVPAFAPHTLILIDVPAGADTTGTSATGGTAGTGLVAVSNLTIGAHGEPNDTLTIEFEIRLAPVIISGTVVLNQGELLSASTHTLYSDDPNVPGDADPTETRITSAPRFEVSKRSAILEGDPDILMAGETLRYTITIKNIGTENAADVILRDYTPANTLYVANSTTLNGVAVPDPNPGVNPLHAGIAVHAPENTTAGYLRADAAPGTANVATVTFVVAVDSNVMDGMVICNQGFVSGSGVGSGAQPEQPSDDPETAIPDDPTCNIVGNLPHLYAHKTVRIQVDNGSVGIVDPEDVLRYTIVISNFGAIPATDVMLTDAVPTHTTYVADSLRLNGVSPGPDGGISPLIAGLAVHSADNPGTGIISARQSAVITFDARVDAGVSTGTLISNQGTLTSHELQPDHTDADGVPSNGRQPTVVVVGEVQWLSITKEVLVVGSGTAEAGGQLEYVIRVTNNGTLPATHVMVTDDLSPPLGNQVTYVDGSGTLNGSAAGVSYAGAQLSANYAAVHGDLQPGSALVVRFRVRINAALAMGTTITNTGEVHWNNPAQSISASVSIDVGGIPGSGGLNGIVWHDANLDKLCDSTERGLENWSVELYRDNQLVVTVLTGADGAYRIRGVIPNEGTATSYELRFRAPEAGLNTASMGQADSIFTNGPQRITDIVAASGANLLDLNLPLWPNGTVYNSVVREAVSGAGVRMLNATSGAALPDQCFDDPVQQNQVTARDGFYKFDLNFSSGACPAGGAYLIEVTAPATGYIAGPSRIIPPGSSAATAPFSIPSCPGSASDAVPATAEYCEATDSAAVPPASVPPRTAGTTYYLHLTLGNGHLPGHSQIFNNPIPLDPVMEEAVAITKVSSLVNVNRSSLVPYTITVTNSFGVPLYDIAIVDRIPPGFKYVKGSARLDGQPLEPHVTRRDLVWDDLALQVNTRYTLQFLLVVGSGVAEGEYVNRAFVRNSVTGAALSGEATATVRVVPDPTFDCTDIIGKVFDDRNLNGRQDGGEDGLPGVRLVTARGLIATTDQHGRFHITCAAVPDEDRGSNFILKLDERSLPSGYRLTTENPRVQRATRGKMLRFNFGATIHRVVRIDISDGVFEPDTSELRLQWKPKITRLLEELKKAPSVLRLSYLADVEREGLVRKRLEALKKEVTREWDRSAGGYQLFIETEVFWRRGAPIAGRRTP
jgi:large repetitive protein